MLARTDIVCRVELNTRETSEANMLSAGYTVTNWKAIENRKLTKKKGEKKMARMKSSTVEVGAEFVARDGSVCIAQFFKSSNLWNVSEIKRKILVSNVSGNPKGILDSTENDE